MKTPNTMTLQKWYGSALRIPSYRSTYEYANFAASCLGIVNSILKRKLGKEIQIRFLDIETAYANPAEGVIGISKNFVNGLFFPNRPPFPVDITLVALMGIQVHEAAHFAYSPDDLKPYGDYVQKESPCPYQQNIACTLGNIIEDIYIEAEIDRTIPNLSWTLQVLNEIVFEENEEVKRCAAVAGITEAPDTYQAIGQMLDVLVLAKTRDTITATPWVTELFYLVQTAAQAEQFSQRQELCLAVYNLLMARMVGQPEKEVKQPGGEGKKQQGKGSEQEETTSEETETEALAKTQKESAGVTSQAGFSPLGPKKIMRRNSSVDTASLTEKILDTLLNADINMVLDETGQADPTSLFIETVIPLGQPLPMDKRYSKLAEVARQQAVVNRPYGLDSTRGHSIRKLYRIATDQKIFGEAVQVKTQTPMQVLILIDMSGSMRSAEVRGTGEPRHTAAFRAALGAATALAEARCDVAVYGHTADLQNDNSVNIFRAKGFNESLDNLAGRLGTANGKFPSSCNRDGYALDYVAKKFTDPRKKQLIIVISDGMPYGKNYFDDAAVEHCQKIVEKLHSQKIQILSISIDASAESSNNRIYGQENNVYNTDPNVIEQIVGKLINVY